MADKKITQLTNITGANLADADEFVVVDITADETKAITFSELKTAFDTGTGFVRVTGDTMTGDLSFGDNDKAIFGASSDLQIYHDGSHSYVDEQGAGQLRLRGSTQIQFLSGANDYMATMANDGAVTLYYDNAPKLATTATGIDVTGTVTSDGLTVDGLGTITKAVDGQLTLAYNSFNSSTYGYHSIVNNNVGNEFSIHTGNSKTINLAANGDISFYEATGTTPKFFWDSSAESLGIGTSSPTHTLHVNNSIRASSSLVSIDPTGSASAPSLIFNGDDDTGLYRPASNILAISTAGTERMRIDSTGNVGIGTNSPAQKLTVASEGRLRLYRSDNARYSDIYTDNNFLNIETSNDPIRLNGQSYIKFEVSSTERMRINSSGNVGIGTSSPSRQLEVQSSTGGNAYLSAKRNNATSTELVIGAESGNTVISSEGAIPMAFYTDGSERMRIDSSGNVGIGDNTFAAGKLRVYDTAGNHIWLKGRVSDGNASVSFRNNADNAYNGRISTDNTSMNFQVNGSERMRIDSSGNLLVGTSGTNWTTTAGLYAFYQSALNVTRNGAESMNLNRLTNDGTIIGFRKDGATVGSIGTGFGQLVIGQGNTSVILDNSNTRFAPSNADGSGNDGNLSLGWSNRRWSDLYLSGGVYLGGTTAANKLTDYEQGTWTPVDTNGNQYSQAVTATYVKIGKLVYIYMDITSNSNTLATNNNQVAGLPFTTATSSNAGTISQGYNTGSGSVTGHMYGTSIYLMNGESTSIVLNQRLMASGVYHAN